MSTHWIWSSIRFWMRSFVSWISLKMLCSRDMALFAYHDDPWHFWQKTHHQFLNWRAYKLRGSTTQLHSCPEEDWSIWLKCWQDNFLCYQVVYKRTVSNFPCTLSLARLISHTVVRCIVQLHRDFHVVHTLTLASNAINYGDVTLKWLWLDMQSEIHWQNAKGFAL